MTHFSEYHLEETSADPVINRKRCGVQAASDDENTSHPPVSHRKTKRVDKQTHTCAAEPSISDERRAFLEGIKQKVKSGYYMTLEVTEDICDGFAHAFDQGIS
ncbi:MAG: hypothetical protein JW795_08545 [Chitinivibrionales bacterium]|nr:hypothetical protein [Chitinivibrionales bacterium]